MKNRTFPFAFFFLMSFSTLAFGEQSSLFQTWEMQAFGYAAQLSFSQDGNGTFDNRYFTFRTNQNRLILWWDNSNTPTTFTYRITEGKLILQTDHATYEFLSTNAIAAQFAVSTTPCITPLQNNNSLNKNNSNFSNLSGYYFNNDGFFFINIEAGRLKVNHKTVLASDLNISIQNDGQELIWKHTQSTTTVQFQLYKSR